MKQWEFEWNDTILRYLLDETTQHISMLLLPKGIETKFQDRRTTLSLRDNICRAWDIGSLCHVSLRHHAQGNGAGNTLKYSESTEKLKYISQDVQEQKDGTKIITLLKAEEGYGICHSVCFYQNEQGVEIETEFFNETHKTVTLDMITSFSLDNLSPYQTDAAPYRLRLHRFRGGWSLEGKHQTDTVEELNLEETWFRVFPESERYGCLGSHPVKRWFPFGCVEDTEYGVYWAAQMEAMSSWQMEFSKDGDCYSLSGGLADSEFGGWWKDIPAGGRFRLPKAFVSTSKKGLWDVCQNITGMYHRYADLQPEIEKDLPIMFNEWCTTWGNPTEQGILEIASKLKDLPVPYLVIDAGWSEKQYLDGDPQGGNGDWICDRSKFPNGLKYLAQKLKKDGYTLGIWMEFEVTTTGARVHSGNYDLQHLYRNGEIIQTGGSRRFWDFRQPEVIQYLRKTVLEFLRDNEIGYFKVDYNGSVGAGCDGAESMGEGLRQQMQAVRDFFVMLRQELPELVIENCASGGHRLEPSMMNLTSVSTFSDAHECQEIPYIAANLHLLTLPRQTLVFVVLSPELSLQEIQYRLVSGLLGRICLSGEINRLNRQQWELVKESLDFYQTVKEIIKYGRSRMVRRTADSSTDNQHNLRGSQILLREMDAQILLVYHSFSLPPERMMVCLPEGSWKIVGQTGKNIRADIHDQKLELFPVSEWEAAAFYLEKI